MEKLNFEDGQLVSNGYVEIDGVQHQVHEAEYTGNTPLSAYNLNRMQDNIENAIIDTPATQTQNGLMSKEDKIKLDGLENTEVIQEDGQANSTNVYSAEATKQIIESTKGWKLHEEVIGNQPINIADLEFTELLIVAKFNNTGGNFMLGSSLVLPEAILTETLEYYDMGSTVYITRIGINKNYLVLNMCSAYGNDFASTTHIKVFYK